MPESCTTFTGSEFKGHVGAVMRLITILATSLAITWTLPPAMNATIRYDRPNSILRNMRNANYRRPYYYLGHANITNYNQQHWQVSDDARSPSQSSSQGQEYLWNGLLDDHHTPWTQIHRTAITPNQKTVNIYVQRVW
jgi:hypothetical protein